MVRRLFILVSVCVYLLGMARGAVAADISGRLFELEEQKSLRGKRVTIVARDNTSKGVIPITVAGETKAEFVTETGDFRFTLPDNKVFDLEFTRDDQKTRTLEGLISKTGPGLIIDVTVPEAVNMAQISCCPTSCCHKRRPWGFRRRCR
jgi:hypothetical protein